MSAFPSNSLTDCLSLSHTATLISQGTTPTLSTTVTDHHHLRRHRHRCHGNPLSGALLIICHSFLPLSLFHLFQVRKELCVHFLSIPLFIIIIVIIIRLKSSRPHNNGGRNLLVTLFPAYTSPLYSSDAIFPSDDLTAVFPLSYSTAGNDHPSSFNDSHTLTINKPYLSPTKSVCLLFSLDTLNALCSALCPRCEYGEIDSDCLMTPPA